MAETQERDRTPEGRFRYLAEKRVGKALTAIRSVANLSERKNYAYTPDQATQIIEALTDAVDELAADFSREQRKAKSAFELK